MSGARHKVLVVGGGPAGLAAAEALLDGGRGRVEVDLVTLEPYLGGSAASFTTRDGRVVEQGQHIMVGFYREMEALLRRAGVDVDRTTTPNRGHVIIWEDRDEQAHPLHLGPSSVGALLDGLRYTGLTFREKLGFGAVLTRAIVEILGGVPESWDDLCLSAWCLERGMPSSFVASNAFRASREGQFNWPGEISAYSVLQTLREMARDFTTSEIRFPTGSMSDLWWEPVARRVEGLGGRIHRGHQLVRIRHAGGHVTGLDFRLLRPGAGKEDFLDTPIPAVPGSDRTWHDFDAAVLTIPAGSMQDILGLDPALAALPGFRGIPRLKTVAPMGIHVWHQAPVTAGPRTLICGLDMPSGVAIDNKPHHAAYRNDARFGSVIHFVGPETGFEDWRDEALVARALKSLRRVPGYEKLTMEGVLGWKVVRDRAPHRRYWLSEPGSLKHKPTPRTVFPELWFAGDWVRSDADFPCMETAIRSGRGTARMVLKHLRRQGGREAA